VAKVTHGNGFSSHSTGCLKGEKEGRRRKRKEKGRDCGKPNAFYLLSYCDFQK
jgi:hypothetical protein